MSLLVRALYVQTDTALRHLVDHVTKVHFLKFDLVKPIFHFRASRRPKALMSVHTLTRPRHSHLFCTLTDVARPGSDCAQIFPRGLQGHKDCFFSR
jgi:hypothetical protein